MFSTLYTSAEFFFFSVAIGGGLIQVNDVVFLPQQLFLNCTSGVPNPHCHF